MSEMPPDTPVSANPVPASSAGALLRQAREAAGVHIAALAASLKVPVEKLEALEANQHELFTDLVFMRGLAASVCRHLRMDAAPVLALLPGGTPAPLPQQRSLNATYKDSQPKSQPGSPGKSLERRPSKVMGLTVLLLLAATLAVALYPATPEALQNPQAEAGQQGTDEAPVLAQEPVAPAQADPGHAVATAAPNAAAPGALGTAPASQAQSALTSSTQLSVASASDLAFADVLVLKAVNQAWVQIRDAAGQTQQKTLQAGESLTASGTAPWKVVIGNVKGTEVLVRGQPMDLSYVGKSNVARFEVQ